jgi:hypothetical protein
MIYTENKISYEYAKNAEKNAITFHQNYIYEINHKGNMLAERRNASPKPQGSAEYNLSTTTLDSI